MMDQSSLGQEISHPGLESSGYFLNEFTLYKTERVILSLSLSLSLSFSLFLYLVAIPYFAESFNGTIVEKVNGVILSNGNG